VQPVKPDKPVEISIDTPPPAPKTKPPPPAPPPPPPKAAPVAVPPAPAAAQAGKVLTADPPPDQPVDMTDQGFVTGNGDSFAGGQTAADGTSKTAVGSLAARGAGARTPPPPPRRPPPPPDLSRPARPTALAWNCGFPPEAQDVDHARVVITVTVGPDGSPESARVDSDPGNGFGRVARNCAMAKHYQPGLDKAGHPTTTNTPPFVVRFDR
jgi:protein TonB